MKLTNQGKTLSLRQTIPDDAPILLKAYHDHEFINVYRSNNPKQTEEELRELLQKRLTVSPFQLGFVEFLIEHYRHGAIGVAVLGDYSALHKRAELLIGLFDETQRNLIYGVEATLLVFDLAFNHYEINKIYTYVYEYNKISQTNVEKLGFTKEGYLKKHHFSKTEQKFYDLYVSGFVVDDFRNSEKMRKFSSRFLGWDITQPIHRIQITEEQRLSAEQQQAIIDKMRQAFSHSN
jgi:RimJ/RimL family protein N-acetyltransferase